MFLISGRTLEETAALFDGAQDELELHELGTAAATQSFHALRDDGIIELTTPSHRISYALPPISKEGPTTGPFGKRRTIVDTESDVNIAGDATPPPQYLTAMQGVLKGDEEAEIEGNVRSRRPVSAVGTDTTVDESGSEDVKGRAL